MNKIMIFSLALTLMGGMIFAGGETESSSDSFRPGYGLSMQETQELEIVSIKGAVVKDSYGNFMISQGGKNYLVRVTPTLDYDLEEGVSVEGEGVVGGTVYTRDGKEYKEFFLTLVTVNGETRTVDLARVQGYGSMGRSGRSTMMDRGRGSRNFDSDDDNRGFMGDRGFMGPGGMMGQDFTDGEEKTLSGTITLYKEEYPMLATSEGNYVLMLGHNDYEDLKAGMTVEATGFTGHTLYSNGGEDYYSFMVTSAVINGKEVELDHTPFSGRDGFRGSFNNKMMPRGGRSFRN